MNDIRRTILWVIFGFSMVLLWDHWQVANGKKATFFPSPAVQASAPAADGKPVDASVPQAVNAPAVLPAASPAAPAAVAHERFDVRTDVLKLTLDTEGGSLVRAELLKYTDAEDKSHNVVLLDDSKDRIYLAQSGVVAGSNGGAFPTHKTVMTASGAHSLKDGENELVISFTSPDVGGIKLVKTYTLRRGAYDIAVKHELVNTSATPQTPQLYLQLVRDGNKPAGGSSFYSTYTGPAVYTDAKKFEKVDFSDIKKHKADFEKSSANGYVAMVQHYFASAWILPDGMQRNLSMDAVDIGATLGDCCYRATMVAPLDTLAPGASKVVNAKLFVGPQEEKLL